MLTSRESNGIEASLYLISGSLELGAANAFQRKWIKERLQQLLDKGNKEFEKHSWLDVCADPTCEKVEHVNWRLANGVDVKIFPKHKRR
jgi:hypothetical protein